MDNDRLPLRIIVTSIHHSGDDIVYDVLKGLPGAFIHEFPLMKLSFHPVVRPDTPEAAYAAEAILDLAACNHKRILGTARD